MKKTRPLEHLAGVMAGLVLAIRVFVFGKQDMDAATSAGMMNGSSNFVIKRPRSKPGP